MTSPADNAVALDRELGWLGQLIDARLRLHFGQPCAQRDVRELAPPDLTGGTSALACLGPLSFDERGILILALAPHLRPHLLDPFLQKNPIIDRGFTEFGGVVQGNHGGFWPTVETAAFLLAGEDLERRFSLQPLFDPDRVLRAAKLLQLDEQQLGQSLFSTPLHVGKEALSRLTAGDGHKPGFSSAFPARRLATVLEWKDLVLPAAVLEEVDEIRAWIEHRQALLHDWHLDGKIKPGFRSLFYGPPGTGKTLTASLLGKATGLDVYRVDLSLVVSKWVGETEKNLASTFDQAEAGDWILFFDEADALFGQRTQTSGANDRYANQDVAYLLQRIEEFPGTIILASNLKHNIDEVFARRFQSMIYFPVPSPAERLRLWQSAFSDPQRLDSAVDLARLADEHKVTGGAIVNVLRYASLMAVRRGATAIQLQDIVHGIRRELRKDGKVI